MSWNVIIGHEQIKERLRAAIENERLAHALLFIGPDGIGKDALAIAKHHWIYEQVVFIDQAMLRQGMHQHAAAIDEDVFAGLLLELSHFIDDVAADED